MLFRLGIRHELANEPAPYIATRITNPGPVVPHATPAPARFDDDPFGMIVASTSEHPVAASC